MHVDVFKLTDDDWYPPFWLSEGRHLVMVAFDNLDTGEYRVSAWGQDDMGLERDFDNESQAWNVFQQIIGLEKVNQHQLIHEFEFRSA